MITSWDQFHHSRSSDEAAFSFGIHFARMQLSPSSSLLNNFKTKPDNKVLLWSCTASTWYFQRPIIHERMRVVRRSLYFWSNFCLVPGTRSSSRGCQTDGRCVCPLHDTRRWRHRDNKYHNPGRHREKRTKKREKARKDGGRNSRNSPHFSRLQ